MLSPPIGCVFKLKYYEISRTGEVKRKKDGKVIKSVRGRKGYSIIRLKVPAFSKNKDIIFSDKRPLNFFTLKRR